MKLQARAHAIHFPRPAMIMGIVNLGADSFSGDGLPEVEQALAHAQALVEHGADWIDLGAESARTNRQPIGEQEEIDRLAEFLTRWKAPVPLSINTWRPAVVRAVLPLGGDLLNDIGGLPDAENARLCARHGVALLIMHTIGLPKVAHTHVAYGDVMAALEEFFVEKLRLVEEAGLARDATVLDPGLDFAKQEADNLRIFRELRRLHAFGRPLLLPISRKTFIGQTLGLTEPAERDAGTVACLVEGIRQGAQIFRVHNVRAAVQAARIVEAVEAGG